VFEPGVEESVNNWLLKEGHAIEYK